MKYIKNGYTFEFSDFVNLIHVYDSEMKYFCYIEVNHKINNSEFQNICDEWILAEFC